mgnify:CR=1 FL=1
MKDSLGNELTVGATVVYCQTNHSVTPLVGVVQSVADETVTIVTSTKRTIVRNHYDVIKLK